MEGKEKAEGAQELCLLCSLWWLLIYSYESQVCAAKQPQATSSAAHTLVSSTPVAQPPAGTCRP